MANTDAAPHIIAKLDELAEIKAAADLTRMDYEAKRAEILRAIQAELEALEAEYQPLLNVSTERIAALEEEVRYAVLRHGASVKGSSLHAVYSKGRVSWDTKALDGYALSHPEVVDFRRQSEPSISLRFVK
ncbi:MAG: hypothetical protein ACRDH2_11645 [Anaerolineales bacterium]